MSRPRLVLFGDSITQFGFGELAGSGYGWISRLSSTYSRRADVLSRGFSGYNTRHALGILPSVLTDCGAGTRGGRVLFYTLWFGANDAALPGTRQHVPAEEYAANIKKMVGLIRSAHDDASTPVPPIVLITPPPVFQPWWEEWCKTYGRDKSDRTNEASRQYGLAMQSVGKELECETLDTWTLLGGDAPGYERYLTDGLHLSEEGNKAIYEGLMALVENKFPNLAPMTEEEGRYGEVGVPLCEKLWTELC
mmetsp:Transcript_22473/g.64613  ORF Transcript_22473/g.64613 Transcript_22473/m.64613 type:complete len:250 (-) Transcript_22473:457-1206(-)